MILFDDRERQDLLTIDEDAPLTCPEVGLHIIYNEEPVEMRGYTFSAASGPDVERLVEASTYVQKVLSTIVHGTGWWTTDRRKVLEMIGDCDDRIRAALAPFTERRS